MALFEKRPYDWRPTDANLHGPFVYAANDYCRSYPISQLPAFLTPARYTPILDYRPAMDGHSATDFSHRFVARIVFRTGGGRSGYSPILIKIIFIVYLMHPRIR